MSNEDRFILIFVILAIIIWFAVLVYRWLYAPERTKMFFLQHAANGEAMTGRAVELLEQHGYKVLYGKHKLGLVMTVDDDQDPYRSNLFYDYFVQSGRDLYAVKIAKDRKPLRWSGTALRDQFLALYLAYEALSGVLYVDLQHDKVTKIEFELNDYDHDR